jgi:hypothetical protein
MIKTLSQTPAAIAARKWRAANPGANAAACANWQKNNPAEATANVRRWQRANAEKFKAQHRAASARYRARKRAAGQITFAGIVPHASANPARGANP